MVRPREPSWRLSILGQPKELPLLRLLAGVSDWFFTYIFFACMGTRIARATLAHDPSRPYF